jgi:NitT/TauT family transport system substrate-binding protein
MRRSSLFARLMIVAIAVAAIAGCARPDAPLRISLPPWPSFEYLYLAQEQGYFEQEGVEVTLVEFAEASDAFRAYDHGTINGGLFSIQQLLHTRDRSERKWQVAMIVGTSTGADGVFAAPGIEDMPALRGRRVGTLNTARQMYVLGTALERHGMTLQDIVIVPVRENDMAQSLREGRVDAVVNPLAAANIEGSGVGRPIFTSRELPEEIIEVMALDESVLRERPKDVTRLIRAFNRAVRYAQEEPEEATRIMAAREHVTPEVFSAMLAGTTLVSLADQQRFFGKDSRLPAVAAKITRKLHDYGVLSSPLMEGELLNGGPALAAAGS